MSDSVSGKMVDGLFKRVLAPDVTPALTTQLAAVGVDLAAPPPHSYPRATWYQVVDVTAKVLFPDLAAPAQHRKLGAHIIESLKSREIIKGPFLSMAKFMGPRRALKQAMEFSDRSPVKLSLAEISKTEMEITVDDREQPDFLAGLVESAINLLGGKSAAVSLKGPQGDSNVFRASWK